MFDLTGDYYTVAQVLGHSLKGAGDAFNIPGLGQSITQRYIGSVSMERKKIILSEYHKALYHPDPEKDKGLRNVIAPDFGNTNDAGKQKRKPKSRDELAR